MGIAAISTSLDIGSYFSVSKYEKKSKNLFTSRNFHPDSGSTSPLTAKNIELLPISANCLSSKDIEYFESLAYRLLHPGNNPINMIEFISLLDEVEEGLLAKMTNEKLAWDLFNYYMDCIRMAAVDPKERAQVEKEIAALFDDDDPEKKDLFAVQSSGQHCINQIQNEICFRKKESKFKKAWKCTKSYVKRNRKAIIITSCVILGVAAIAVTTAIIANSVATTALTQATTSTIDAIQRNQRNNAPLPGALPSTSPPSETTALPTSPSEPVYPSSSEQPHLPLQPNPTALNVSQLYEPYTQAQTFSNLNSQSIMEDIAQFNNERNGNESIAFCKAFGKGLYRGGKDSVHGLTQLGLDFISHPIDTADNICNAFRELSELALTDQWAELSEALLPEAYQLVTDWKTLSPEQRGELAGYVTGKVGADIIIPGAAGKLAAKGVRGAEKLLKISKVVQKVETPLIAEALTPIENAARAIEMIPANPAVRVIAGESIAQRVIFGEGNFAVEKLMQAGNAMDRQGLTKAGRALAKHGGRDPTVFPKPTGNPTQINIQGQQILGKILNHPEKKIYYDPSPRFGNVIDIEAPGIGGVRFTEAGELIGFLQPKN